MGFDDFFEQRDKRKKYSNTIDYRFHDAYNPYLNPNSSEGRPRHRNNSQLPYGRLLIEKLRSNKRLRWNMATTAVVLITALTVIVIVLLPFVVQLLRGTDKL